MAKITENKLSVDTYTEDFDRGVLKCLCYTPGAIGEAQHIEKEVTLRELQEAVCNYNGKVEVTYQGQPEKTAYISFWTWYDGLRFSSEVNDYLADIINKRENRIPFSVTPKIANNEKVIIGSLLFGQD